MPIVFLGAVHASILKLRCPECGKEQVRARQPVGERYECERCMKRFLLEDGLQLTEKKEDKGGW